MHTLSIILAILLGIVFLIALVMILWILKREEETELYNELNEIDNEN
jgi:flagellar biosynthesis/type III secretory pathway M-ring protein FliF/YscJ